MGGMFDFIGAYFTQHISDPLNINLFVNESYNKWLYYIIIIIFLPGIMLQKNKNISEILRFNHLGGLSKYVSNFIYLFITMLVFAYLFLNIYLTKKLSENNCYILRHIQERELIGKDDKIRYIEITKKIRTDIVKRNSLATNNTMLLVVALVIYGFYTNIFDGFVDFFRAGSGHAKKIGDSFSCGNNN